MLIDGFNSSRQAALPGANISIGVRRVAIGVLVKRHMLDNALNSLVGGATFRTGFERQHSAMAQDRQRHFLNVLGKNIAAPFNRGKNARQSSQSELSAHRAAHFDHVGETLIFGGKRPDAQPVQDG